MVDTIHTSVISVPVYECLRCGHSWPSRFYMTNGVADKVPKICPKCKSLFWNKPRVRPVKEKV